jgi:hypothetical protein
MLIKMNGLMNLVPGLHNQHLQCAYADKDEWIDELSSWLTQPASTMCICFLGSFWMEGECGLGGSFQSG